MHTGAKAQKKEKSAMSVSLYGNIIFVALELIMAVYTGSQAVLLDAVYDGVEFFMLLPSIFLIPLFYKPSSEKHPFGFTQIESMFVVVKGVTMIAVTIGLIVNNIQIMLHGGRTISFGIVAWFELIACALGIAVYIYLKKKNRIMNSNLVDMEITGWQIDSVASFGMSLAFFLPVIIPFGPFKGIIPYLDQLITIVLSVFMIKAPISAVIAGLRDLFLMPPEEETIEEIKDTIVPILSAYGYQKLHYDILRTGRKLWISVYITFDRDEISISRFKIVQNYCIQALAKIYPDFYFELLPNIEFNKEQTTPSSY